MEGFNYKEGQLYVDDLPLSEIADTYGTPAYIYSYSEIRNNFKKYADTLRNEDLICYAVKANSNIHILKELSELGSGFDVVSGNELKRCIKAGAERKKIVFSGVAKSLEDLELAINEEILSINIESEDEFDRVVNISEALNKEVHCSIRINPDIPTGSHKYIETGLKTSKFGVDTKTLTKISSKAINKPLIKISGTACHIGSQISDNNLIMKSLDHLLNAHELLKKDGHDIKFLDVGGGLGITYKKEIPGDPESLISEISNKIEALNLKIILEPGRSITGSAGVLISKVEYLKLTEYKNFAILDVGMNDLMRPALYDAWHNVRTLQNSDSEERIYELVGPVCESADVLAKDRKLAIAQKDVIAIMDVGSYGSVMSSNYNSRLKAPEIMVSGSSARIIKRRESFEDLIALEKDL
ncbi:MAG TPA: diaminopimelate decarboxylase [SAR86 cluster bacterium]|nr:diaminopimelate decarboxylase [SAR86 cluster bacterium]